MPTDPINPRDFGNFFREDEEFANLCPPLDLDAKNLLADSIERDGCLSPLIVWQEERLLVDGHNRSCWCQKFNKPARIEFMSFPSREAAANWIIDHQLGRRNLNPQAMSYLRGKKFNLEKKAAHRPQGELRQNVGVSGETAERIAKQTGVSARTIERDAEFAAAVDAMEPEEKEAVLSGQVKKTKSEILGKEKKTDSEPKAEKRTTEKRANVQLLKESFSEILEAIKSLNASNDLYNAVVKAVAIARKEFRF